MHHVSVCPPCRLLFICDVTPRDYCLQPVMVHPRCWKENRSGAIVIQSFLLIQFCGEIWNYSGPFKITNTNIWSYFSDHNYVKGLIYLRLCILPTEFMLDIVMNCNVSTRSCNKWLERIPVQYSRHTSLLPIYGINKQNKGVLIKINTRNIFTVSGHNLMQFSAISLG